MEDAANTQQELLHLVQATQIVAARAALVHAGAPSLLGQLLPSALQLWSQDRLDSASGESRSKSDALMKKHSKDIEEAAARLAADPSMSDFVQAPWRSPSNSVTLELQSLKVSEPGPDEQQPVMRVSPAKSLQRRPDASSVSRLNQPSSPPSHSFPPQRQSLVACTQECRPAPSERMSELSAPEMLRQEGRLERSDSFSSMPDLESPNEPAEPEASASMSTAEYLTIEDEENGDTGSPVEPSKPLPQMSAAGQQLLLLLRVLRNLCATGIEATKAMADEGVPEQVAHLVSDPLQGNTEGTAQLSKVAAQLLANMSANEGQALDAVWRACYPKTFINLSGFERDVHGPLCRALLHCCSASEKYAVELCGASGSVILRRLLAASEGQNGDNEVEEQVMELGWLLGHLVYVRGLLPELFGALAEVQAEDSTVGATLDPLQCVLLELLSEEMENGSTRQQLKVSAEVAPEKALRSLVFLVTTIREVGSAIAKTGGDAPLEASILEAAFQVLKDLFALDDGAPITKGSRRVSGRTLGSALCRQGLVPLLLSFLVALGPIRSARPAASGGAQTNISPAPSVEPSITATAASLPRLPPYLGFRTDIVAVLAHAAYGRREVQDEILRLGGVHIMLSQCQVDGTSPMVREWALWGVRNMCMGNEAVQRAIMDLQPVAPLQNPELTQLGLQVQLDPASGKWSVAKQSDAG